MTDWADGDLYDRIDELRAENAALRATIEAQDDALMRAGRDTFADGADLRAEHLGRVQPAPTPTDEPSAHDLVIAELEKRKAFGIAKYGVTLQAGNGRDHLQDALDEVLDLAVYLMCVIEQTEEDR